MDEFYNYMNQEEQLIRVILTQNNAMIELTEEQIKSFRMATVCDTCNKKFTPNNTKTRHHCHITGKYIAPVCQACNLQLKYRTGNCEFFVSCFFFTTAVHMILI